MNADLVKALEELHQLDIDAVHAYEEAIERIENPFLKRKLDEYKKDHERHLDALEELIVAKGGQRPDRSRDVKGFFIQGMTLLRSSMGDEQALMAMGQNEETTNKRYREALKELQGDQEVGRILNRNYADERKHFTFIKEALTHFSGFRANEQGRDLEERP